MLKSFFYIIKFLILTYRDILNFNSLEKVFLLNQTTITCFSYTVVRLGNRDVVLKNLSFSLKDSRTLNQIT